MLRKTMFRFVLSAAALCWAGLAGTAWAQGNGAAQNRNVTINRVRLADGEVGALEQRFQIRLPDGSYWYDKRSGAWGVEGGPAAGLAPAGLAMGGALRADASHGNTRVFVNGRELHTIDVMRLQQLGPVYPGRYWLDAMGNCGYEGGPALVNLVQLANAAARRQGGAWSRAGSQSWMGADANGTMHGQFKDGLGNSHVF
jgi:hypothetical protein